MKTKLKISLTPKGISYFLMLTLMVFCTACGGDDDEPDNKFDNDDSAVLTSADMFSPSILTGQWMIESIITDENTIPLNLPITILPFNIKVTTDVTKDGKGNEYWAEKYSPFAFISTESSSELNYCILSFAKSISGNLNSSLVYGLVLTVFSSTQNKAYIFSMTKFKYSNQTLISYIAFYSEVESGSVLKEYEGEISLKKII